MFSSSWVTLVTLELACLLKPQPLLPEPTERLRFETLIADLASEFVQNYGQQPVRFNEIRKLE